MSSIWPSERSLERGDDPSLHSHNAAAPGCYMVPPMAQGWTYSDFVKDALTRVGQVSCEQLASRLQGGTSPVLLDVREPDEVAGGFLPGAVLLPRGLIENHVQKHVPDRTRPVYVYCATGNRSALAAD